MCKTFETILGFSFMICEINFEVQPCGFQKYCCRGPLIHTWLKPGVNEMRVRDMLHFRLESTICDEN